MNIWIYLPALLGCLLVSELSAVEHLSIDAPIGTLSFAAIHEAGHVTIARSLGLFSVTARVFQKSTYGAGTFWKGQTSLGRGYIGKGMALIKLGGNFAEHFLDDSGRIYQPSFLDIIGNRGIISKSDQINQTDLGGDSLLEAQRKTFFILRGRLADLDKIYKRLYYNHVYP
jgi:hypothetical protein